MPPEFTPLPLLGSPERKKMVENLANAFGKPIPGQFGAADPDMIYDVLSQLSYADRITLLREVFKFQGIDPNNNTDPEKAVRTMLLNRLGRGPDQKPTFVGVNRFFHLMSDAPQDARYKALLSDEMYYVDLNFPEAEYTDRLNADVAATIKAFKSGNDPYQMMRNIGITPGAPPSRKPPLAIVVAPKYTALPPVGSDERNALVADLVKLSGQPTQFNADGKTGFKGFQDPDAFFQKLAAYNYENRIALYREVLKAQGLNDMATMPEANIRLHLMRRFMYNSEAQPTYTGMDRYLRFVSDAPRDSAHMKYLDGEINILLVDTDHRSFVDKNDPAVRERYQRFFCIGGFHPDLVKNCPVNRLELVGIPMGRPPQLYKPPVPLSPAPAPCPAPDHPFRLDSQSEQGVLAVPRGLGGWAIPVDPNARVMILPSGYEGYTNSPMQAMSI